MYGIFTYIYQIYHTLMVWELNQPVFQLNQPVQEISGTHWTDPKQPEYLIALATYLGVRW